MKRFTEADLIDYLSGELKAEERLELQEAVAQDATLAKELEELAIIHNWVAEMEEPPSATSEQDILAIVERESSTAVRRSLQPRFWQNYRAAVAAAILIFAGGWYLGQNRSNSLETELAEIRNQVETLMHDQRSSARMRAVSLTHDLTDVDQELIVELGRLLREDDSPNVQLAALEALAAYPNDVSARQELMNALAEDLPAVVQIQLIETLVALKEVRILPQLRNWSEDESTPTHLRDAAQLASLKLARI